MSADFWNGIIANHAASQLRATETVTPDKYRGWDIGYEMKPIPSRVFDWIATSQDFDADCDQDGFFICSGGQVNAATRDELLAEIDAWIEENAE